MSAVLSELLQPQVVLRLISRLAEGRGPLGSWLGFQPTSFDPDTVTISGPNTLQGTGAVRNYTYRIFDMTRVPMKARAPGTGPGVVAQNPMGVNTVSIARWHQKIPLNYEFLGQLSPMIGPNSQIDAGGKNYIAQQTTFLGEQVNNAVEMMAAGMMRDSLYFVQSGDNWLPTFTAPAATTPQIQINFRIPTGNTGQLNMLGAGNIILTSWANPAAPILSDIQSIVAAYAQLSRRAMTQVWINSLMWMNIITNTQVRNTAGSSNSPFAEFDRVPQKGLSDVGPSNKFKAVLRGNPTIEWLFCDDTLALNTDVDPSYSTAPAGATLAKEIPDGMAIFCSEPSSNIAQLIMGGEHVVENEGQAAVLRMGHYFWHQFVTQPSALELIALMNAVPALYQPQTFAPAQVVFP